MALAPFYERVYGALGGHLAISRESLDSVLRRVTVGIQLGSRPNDNEIWIGSLATNLAARIYPKIAITGDTEVRNEYKALADKLKILAAMIVPCGRMICPTCGAGIATCRE